MGRLACLGWVLLGFMGLSLGHAESGFEVSLSPELEVRPGPGRLLVVLSRTNAPEPRLSLGETGPKAPQAFASDLSYLDAKHPARLGAKSYGFPISRLREVPAGDYFVQAVFASNHDLRLVNAPGNLFSRVIAQHLEPDAKGVVHLDLTEQMPAEQLPPETEQIKFIKLQSELLSRFYGRPIYLRAGVILPRDYEREAGRRYPLWVRIGGYGTRYTAVKRLMAPKGEFYKVWQDAGAPGFILLQLDGAGPFGDPYYVNSANNGPYGDALVQELIPAVEQRFRAIAEPRARVLSGTSTGGWVSLALQIFYPDFFNGTWSSCPDPVDFRALERLNIYREPNAYVTASRQERPSERNLQGQITLTMRQEVGAENLLGEHNSYTLSGEQWGAWNAVFSPRGRNGLPVPLWDSHSGRLHRAVARQWERYDLRRVLEQNWSTLGPKLRGKLHIASGEADQYFLNEAVHRLDDFLAHAQPSVEAHIVYGPGKGHGWMDLSLAEMLQDMARRTGTAPPTGSEP